MIASPSASLICAVLELRLLSSASINTSCITMERQNSRASRQRSFGQRSFGQRRLQLHLVNLGRPACMSMLCCSPLQLLQIG
ncbi:hypothetical protein K431DRAFT_11690 [Polychaeton citri CBS 116435]|uniref:Secreted protein n=1 Tax=Polychaeton citri CBS 116435 TaxID=1314669 RepID=A0A9P4Q1K6_9PEZI|nr:hypothetical protein K431DRAFT_11690 [Polychaeton citri CBS 116435]